MTERIPGFYWVKCRLVWHGPPIKVEDIWEVAKWEYGRWYRADDSVATFSDDYFLEIDEEKLERQLIAK